MLATFGKWITFTPPRSRCAASLLVVSDFYIMIAVLSLPGASSLVVPGQLRTVRRPSIHLAVRALRGGSASLAQEQDCTWSPQDLTKDCPGFLPIPNDDYVKQYQRRPELWPVEFFLIAYRRTKNKETQVLVRASANGTSKWGVGTGVPATRWVLSSHESPPIGYEWSEPPVASPDARRIRFEASNFPEFPQDEQQSWAYDKIDIREDALNENLIDPELEQYASTIRDGLRAHLADQTLQQESWDATRIAVVKAVVDKSHSLAAIQGTLRMSGLFSRKAPSAAELGSASARYISLGEAAPDHAKLVRSMRIFTMFPQMPDPMPLPSTPPEELQEEIASRDSRMAESGRDPHQDPHGRRFTHKSTSNPSNTIHGVYLTLDATGLPGLDEVPALDLFGTKEIKREWKSLQDLEVLDADGHISTKDTKPTFISGFIVRQLVKEGVMDTDSPA